MALVGDTSITVILIHQDSREGVEKRRQVKENRIKESKISENIVIGINVKENEEIRVKDTVKVVRHVFENVPYEDFFNSTDSNSVGVQNDVGIRTIVSKRSRFYRRSNIFDRRKRYSNKPKSSSYKLNRQRYDCPYPCKGKS